MSNSDEYIEAYFTNQLNDIEKKLFEERCVQDEVFAKEVAFYITSSEAVRQKLLEQKKQLWLNEDRKNEVRIIRPLKKATLRVWLPYIAAACLVLFFGLYYMWSAQTPAQLAKNYTREHFTQLSQTMNASKDSLQQGIAAYNNKDFNRALLLFEKIYQSHPENYNAKKNIGLVYLITKDYDKALLQFDELTRIDDLYRNPGFFLKAITMLQRNGQGDMVAAKILLERVVSENLEGSREAKKWLENW